MKIKKLNALEILDSRGIPTVRAQVELEDGQKVCASVPSGASTGKFEAHEKRDGGKRYLGKGVRQAVDLINTQVAQKLEGQEIQRDWDQVLLEMDGTQNKERLGANGILAVSLALARAKAMSQGKELFESLCGQQEQYLLPTPMMNILNGGAHAGNQLDFQEFMIMPIGAQTFGDALRQGAEVYQCLKSVIKQKGLQTGVGDEGGFAPEIDCAKKALDLIMQAIQQAGYTPGKDFAVAIDVASSDWYTKEGTYYLPKIQKEFTRKDLLNFYQELISEYPVVSIEDGMGEEDMEGWDMLTGELGSKIQLVGDDLFVTNPKRIAMGVERHIANSVLIKLNQIGSLKETLQAIHYGKEHGLSNIISHRSGETEDHFIADLAVATQAGQIKTGAPARSERTAKYNRLLEIENYLKERALYKGLLTVNCCQK